MITNARRFYALKRVKRLTAHIALLEDATKNLQITKALRSSRQALKRWTKILEGEVT